MAADRLATKQFNAVNEPIRSTTGEVIEVPRKIDLKTGLPVAEKGTQAAVPDAVSYDLQLIVDDKTLTREVLTKDRQEVIRFIRAYQAREGKLPKTIAIQRYDPTTGTAVRTDLYSPQDFLPKAANEAAGR
jgi:hypothetical protein